MIRYVLTLATVFLFALFAVDAHAAALGTAHLVSDSGPSIGHVLAWLSLSGIIAFGTAAISPAGAMTLVDLKKNLDPDGSIAAVIELLNQKNEALEDIPWMEGNLTTGHQTTVRTGLPTPVWTKINQGVVPTNSIEAQITEHCGRLEDYSYADKRLGDLAKNLNAFRLSKAKPHFEGMNQEMMSTLFYGSNLAFAEFIGLSPRYSSLSAGNADNIITAGGTGSTDNASIWLIDWSDESVHGIYPQGTTAGLKHEDKGLTLIQNTAGVAGALSEAYIDHMEWYAGLALVDWRGAVRICNIDVSNLTSASDAADLLYYMADAEERIPHHYGKRVFYMNRRLRRFLRHQAKEAVGNGGGITFENVAGKPQMMFGTTPIHTVDALLNTEDVVQ